MKDDHLDGHLRTTLQQNKTKETDIMGGFEDVSNHVACINWRLPGGLFIAEAARTAPTCWATKPQKSKMTAIIQQNC